MANTFKHKFLGKWNNGFQDIIPTRIKKYWDRKNNDKGEFMELRAKKKEQILNKEMNRNVNHDTQAVP